MQTKKNLLLNSPWTVVLSNLVIFFVFRTILIAEYKLSLALIILTVILLLFLEQKDVINRLFTLYNDHVPTALVSAVLLIGVLLPISLTNKNYIAHIMIMGSIYSIACLGLNFQMGSTDMTNFAPAAFMGIGAYSVAVCTLKFGLSPWVGLLLAILTSAIFGVLIGLPTLRTKGYYLSLVTMAVQIAFTELLKNIRYLGASDGLAGIKRFNLPFIKLADGKSFEFYKKYTVFGIKFAPQIPYLLLVIAVLILLTYVAIRVYHCRIGLSLNTIAQDQVAANCFGIHTTKRKLFAFVIGGVFCGIAGAFFSGVNALASPDDFNFARSLMLICMVILGGMDNSVGIIMGAFLLTIISEKLRDFADFQQMAYGLILVITLIVRKNGLIPKRVRDYRLDVTNLLGKKEVSDKPIPD